MIKLGLNLKRTEGAKADFRLHRAAYTRPSSLSCGLDILCIYVFHVDQDVFAFIQLFYGGLDNKEFRYSNTAVLHLHL